MKGVTKGQGPTLDWNLLQTLSEDSFVGRHQWDEVYLGVIAALVFLAGIFGEHLL